MSLNDLQADLDQLLKYIGSQLTDLDSLQIDDSGDEKTVESDHGGELTTTDEELIAEEPSVPFAELSIIDTAKFIKQHFPDEEYDEETPVEQIYPEQLPPSVQETMAYLEEHALRTSGIFRKCGLKARIRTFHEKLIKGGQIDEETCVHDAADWLKAWFRATGPLVTPSLLTALVEEPSTVDSWRALLLREHCTLAGQTTQRLLLFLHAFSKHSVHSGMNSRNLAICWAPAVLPMSACGPSFSSQSESNMNGRLVHEQLTKKLAATMEASRTVLQSLIENAPQLYAVPKSFLSNAISKSVEATIQKITVTASPQDILLRLLYQRHCYDPLISEWRVVKKPTNDTQEQTGDLLSIKLCSRCGHERSLILKRDWLSAEGEIRLTEQPFESEGFRIIWSIKPIGGSSSLSGRITVIDSGSLLLGGRTESILRTTMFALMRIMATNVQRSFQIKLAEWAIYSRLIHI
ncbi:Rho GTPase-activating protein 7 [Halotydeus destructor]|nr:Rho GTPase-activating protein 7 [Halotydeus destructor]